MLGSHGGISVFSGLKIDPFLCLNRHDGFRLMENRRVCFFFLLLSKCQSRSTRDVSFVQSTWDLVLTSHSSSSDSWTSFPQETRLQRSIEGPGAVPLDRLHETCSPTLNSFNTSDLRSECTQHIFLPGDIISWINRSSPEQ